MYDPMYDLNISKITQPPVDLSNHDCGIYGWWENDAQGITLCRVCDECIETKLARYRPEILTGYTQNDVCEPIEDEL